MRRAGWILLAVLALSIPPAARADLAPAEYKTATQAELVGAPEANAGKKFQVTDDFLFCGSDFCVQFLKTKVDTRAYYCFALGEVCLVRMYLKKDHPDAANLLNLRKGDRVTVYGTFDHVGTNFNFLVVDRIRKVETE